MRKKKKKDALEFSVGGVGVGGIYLPKDNKLSLKWLEVFP